MYAFMSQITIDMLLYLHIHDLKIVASHLKIDYNIYYVDKNDQTVSTSISDDKITIAEKIYSKYRGEPVKLSIYGRQCVYDSDRHDNIISINSLVLFKQFNSTNSQIVKLFKQYNIKFGQIVFYLARNSWLNDTPITYKHLFELYIKYVDNPSKRMKQSFQFNKKGIKNWHTTRDNIHATIFSYFNITD